MELIIFGIILFILTAIVFKIVKKVIKTILIVNLLALLVLAVFFIFIYLDFREMKQHPISDNVFILEDNGKLDAGIINNTSMNEKQEKEYLGYLISKNYKSMISGKYKLFIIKKGITSELELPPEVLDAMGSKDTVMQKQANLYILQSAVSSPNMMINGFKKGKIIIYPETAIFKFIKIIPLPMIETALVSTEEVKK